MAHEFSERLSIIIVSWNTCEILKQCLVSIYTCFTEEEFEVVIVDNDSADGSADMIEREFPLVKIIKSTTNLGFGKACNHALRLARGKYILLLNPDTKIVDNAIHKALCFLRGGNDIGVVGAKLLFPDGSFQPSCGNFPSIRAVFINAGSSLLMKMGLHNSAKVFLRMVNHELMPVRELKSLFNENIVRDVDWVVGAFLIFRREALENDQIFDEDFVMYAEDQDFCRRVKNRGYRIVYYPPATIFHIEGSSAAAYPLQRKLAKIVAKSLFFRKHYGQTSRVTYLIILLAVELVQASNSLGMLMLDLDLRKFKEHFRVHLSVMRVLFNPSFEGLLHQRELK